MTKDYYKPLSVNLTGEIRHRYDEKSTLPIHELIIRPLLENSIDTFVYKGTIEEFFLYGKMQIPIELENIDILKKDKHKFKFDKTKECIFGNEYLWNATTWKRGSIVIVLEYGRINFAELFKNTNRPELTETPNSGNSPSAIKKCKEEMANGNIAILFSASNGLEWMSIYANKKIHNELVELAKKNCNEKDYYK